MDNLTQFRTAAMPVLPPAARRLRMELLRLLLLTETAPEGNLEAINRYYGYHLTEGAYNILLVRVVDRERLERAPADIWMQVETAVREALSPWFWELETLVAQGQLVCFVNITSPPEAPETDAFKAAINGLFSGLQAREDLAGYFISMGEGTPVPAIEQLGQAMFSARNAIEYGVVYGLDKKYDSNFQTDSLIQGAELLSRSDLRAISDCIHGLCYDRCAVLAEELFSRRSEEIRRQPVLAYMLSVRIIKVASAALEEWMPLERGDYEHLQVMEKRVSEARTLAQLQELSAQALGFLCRCYDAYLNRGVPRSVWQAQSYMRENFTREDLTLGDIAAHVGLSPQYFSVLFKRERGLSVVEYLTDLRLERAKELLSESRESVAAIAAAVGYRDSRYFSRVFQKTVGVYPREYRKHTAHAARPQPEG